MQRLLKQVQERAPATVVVLLNPKLVDMQSTGYGLVGRDLRNMVTETFTIPISLISYSTGALIKVYPGGWAVWREESSAEGGYELVYSSMRRPNPDDIELYLTPPAADGEEGGPGASPLDGLDKFIKGFQAL